MKTLLSGSSLLLLISLQACSTAAIYEGARQGARNECMKLRGSQYQECMQEHQDDYKRYRKKRESASQGN